MPAGTFRAIKVKYEGQGISEPGTERTTWYAPGVGKVRELVEGRERVLKSFTPGKP